jgi:hypothetical protein
VRIIIIFYNMKGEKFKMNNKFKRALSSILAFVMLCSCLCVMNVSSVFADDTEPTTFYSIATNGECNLAAVTSTTTSTPAFGDSSNYVIIPAAEQYGKTEGYLKVTGSSSNEFTVKVSQASTLTIEGYGTGDDRVVKNISDTTKVSATSTMTKKSEAGSIVVTISGAGTYTFTLSGNVMVSKLTLVAGIVTTTTTTETTTEATTASGEDTETTTTEMVFCPDNYTGTWTATDAYEDTLTMNGISFVCASSRQGKIGSSKVNFSDTEAYTKYVGAAGSTNKNGRYITFSTTGKSNVKVYYKGNGASERQLGIISGLPTGTISSFGSSDDYISVSDSAYGIKTFTASSQGVYSLVMTGGFLIYKVVVTPVTDNGNVDNSGETPETPTSTSVALDFRTGLISKDDGTGTFYFANNAKVTANDTYDVQIGEVSYHGTTYGVQGSNVTIVLKNVVGPAKLTLGTADYCASFASDVTLRDADGIATTSFNTSGSKGGTVSFYYPEAKTTDITLTVTGYAKGATASTAYIPSLYVETVAETDVPALVEVNKSVSLATSGINTGDVVTLKDASGNTYTATVDVSGTADFSGNKIALGAATVSVSGYTVESDSITIVSDTNSYTLSATSTAKEQLPAGASTDDYYVGYVATSGYNVYSTVQAAVNAATEGSTIYIANGTFNERVVVNKANLTFIGEGADNTAISYNAYDDTYFHGATVAVQATGFTAKGIKIANTANDEGVESNATALSIGYNLTSTTIAANIVDCVISSQRDTVLFGHSANHTATFTNSTIYGFQDVLCGKGNLMLTNCTWNVNNGSQARLLAPMGGSKCMVTNLTIEGINIGNAVFARVWAQEATSSDSSVIIDGYTDTDGAIATDKTAWSNSSTSWTSTTTGDVVNGFDTLRTGSEKTTDGGDCTNMLWLVRKSSSDNYKTTLATINTANTFESAEIEIDGGTIAHRLIGKINSALVSDANATEVGFTISNDNGSVTVSDDTVYEDNDTYYFVHFLTDVDGVTATLAPYVVYNGYQVEGNTTSTTTFTAAG